MKKILSLTGILVLAAMISANVYAAPTDSLTDPQTAYDNTAALRAALAADRAELNALMAGQNPDPQRARVLAENISKSDDELNRLLSNFGHVRGHHGQGHMNYNMNGNHMAGCC